jgi:hypothetical protein
VKGRVLVAGARGLMGKRVLRLARSWLHGVEVLAGSRRPQRGAGWHQVDLHGPGLAQRLEHMDVLVNAVGPYTYDPREIVAACRVAGCAYVDLAEVPEFLAHVEAGAAQGPACVPGASTVPGLISALARAWDERVEQADVFLGVGSRNEVSSALVFSMLRPLGAAAPGGERYFGRLTPWTPPASGPRLYGRYPAAFEAAGLRRADGERVAVRFHFGCDRPLWTRLLHLGAPVLPHLSDGVLRAASRLALLGVPLAQALGTPLGTLSLVARDATGEALGSIEVSARRDGLDVPAWPAVWAARRLLESPHLRGFQDLADLVTPGQAAAWLEEQGIEVHSTRGLAPTLGAGDPRSSRR